MSEHANIPAEVAAALVKVMTGVKKLAKEDTNKFQRYDFVSVDKFLEATCPLCADAGLVILQEEENVDISTKETMDDSGKIKTSAWLTVRYGFILAHASGASYGPLHRSVMVPANGAQAFGSAQSYALKQFMRALFQIPTGDKDDADNHQAEPLPSNQARPQRPNREPPKAEQKDTRPIGSGTQFRPQEDPFSEPVHTKPKKSNPADFWKRPSLDLNPKNDKSPLQFADSFERALTAAPDDKAINHLVRDNDMHLDRLGLEDAELLNALQEKVKTQINQFLGA
jgi:ERF superfamily